jgi:hypothetical protein
MVNKIFKHVYPMDKFIIFCKTFLLRDKETPEYTYRITFDVFKQLEFHGITRRFLEELKEYYYPSKHIYLTRKITYKRFATILRQICRNLDLPFISKIVYSHNQYSTIYIIHTMQNNH